MVIILPNGIINLLDFNDGYDKQTLEKHMIAMLHTRIYYINELVI